MNVANGLRLVGKFARTVLQMAQASNASSQRSSSKPTGRRPTEQHTKTSAFSNHRLDDAGDYAGCPEMDYSASLPGGHRSGEMLWTWIPFEDDASQGKDRPALVIGADGGRLLVTPATSKDHDRDEEQERRAGRYWMDIGAGDWDSRRRPSEVRLDRIVPVQVDAIRRSSGRVSAQIFGQVADGIRRHWND